jgi:glycerol-3-phosphate acyltransferase PlsY
LPERWGVGCAGAKHMVMPWMQQILGPSVSPGHAMIVFLGCYLLGCFSTGYYLVRWRLGHDIRELGSGSAGARNAGRLLGARGFAITMLGDCAKGFLAVWAARLFAADIRLGAVAMLAVVLGHVFPAQLGFRGGKGAATALGGLLALDPPLALMMVAVLVALCCILRKTTPGGLATFALLPVGGLVLGRGAWEVVSLTALGILLLTAHRNNLANEATQWAAPDAVDRGPDESESLR